MYPMTQGGYNALQIELQHLKSVERPTIITAIAEARAQGDLSENADYDAAREKQGFIEGRIQDLESKLSNSQILDPNAIGEAGKVVFGVTVKLVDNTDKESSYTIVGEDEANIAQGKLSFMSPLAKALMSKYEGDEIQVQAPGGAKQYEILEVTYPTA